MAIVSTPDINRDVELRSASLMAMRLKDPATAEELRNDPAKADELASEAIKTTDAATGQTQYRRALEQDRAVYRYTVLFLGVAILMIAAGIVWLAAHDSKIPESLVAIASTAVGALAGLLSPIGNRS